MGRHAAQFRRRHGFIVRLNDIPVRIENPVQQPEVANRSGRFAPDRGSGTSRELGSHANAQAVPPPIIKPTQRCLPLGDRISMCDLTTILDRRSRRSPERRTLG